MIYDITKHVPDIKTFHNQLEAIFPTFLGLNRDGDHINAEFSEELSTEQLTQLMDITPSEKPVTIQPVTPRQIRQAMVLRGISMQQVSDVINQLPEPTRTLASIEWEYSTAFQRERPLVSQMGQAFGMTSQQLDELWIYAKTL